jgi:cytochrome c peroxidase
MKKWFAGAIASVLFSACSPSYVGVPPVVVPKDSPESRIGERLFREPRFSQFFMKMSVGNVNARIAQGDPVLAKNRAHRRGEVDGPFANQAMSCVACHMVGDAQLARHGGMRGYADFAQRSPIPRLPGDPSISTPRNAPTLLDAFIERPDGVPYLLHYDGEFATTEDLVIGGFTGRNFGWRPDQRDEALKNLVRVIREDDGSSELAQQFGKVSYRSLFKGEDSAISPDTRLAREMRRDIPGSSDEEIIETVKSFVTLYLNALQLSRTPYGIHNGSAYDAFLLANKLPVSPDPGESTADYADRLSLQVQGLGKPEFVEGFDAQELQGLKIFLARSNSGTTRNAGFPQVGNCISCHAPPHFTDFKFHNTGETQDEYDSIHGVGAFAKISIPTFAERIADPNAYLPATAHHVHASDRFRSVPSAEHPGSTDLGAWNVLNNPDFLSPQTGLQQLFCDAGVCDTPEKSEVALARAIATFKTPSLRELALSDPYLHTGRKDTIEDVLRFYQQMSAMQRAGRLRNGDPELGLIQLDSKGVNALSAFLRSLDEDYE